VIIISLQHLKSLLVFCLLLAAFYYAYGAQQSPPQRQGITEKSIIDQQPKTGQMIKNEFFQKSSPIAKSRAGFNVIISRYGQSIQTQKKPKETAAKMYLLCMQ